MTYLHVMQRERLGCEESDGSAVTWIRAKLARNRWITDGPAVTQKPLQ
jgi:hypothetical protein